MPNARAYGVAGTQSPEEQAFVLQMHAAYRDYTGAGDGGEKSVKGASSGAGEMARGAVG